MRLRLSSLSEELTAFRGKAKPNQAGKADVLAAVLQIFTICSFADIYNLAYIYNFANIYNLEHSWGTQFRLFVATNCLA